MEYTIKNLAKLAGISTRTLRYYDEIGLLKPCRINSSGYRIYGEEEVNILQQILLYKELELPLNKIKSIITEKNFDYKKALYDHKENILREQEKLNKLLNNVNKTIMSIEGEIEMKNEEKFEGFKKEKINENEKKYGKEIREKYGKNAVEESYKKFGKLTKEQWEETEKISIEINENIKVAMEKGDINCEEAQKGVRLHKKWLGYFMNCTEVVQLQLSQMYVDDERFTKYYEDNIGQGAATFLRDSVVALYNAKFNENTWQWEI